MRLILYSKPGCHLCEGLLEKLQQITTLPLAIEVRDITSREDWSDAYQFEIPVLMLCQAPESLLPQETPHTEPAERCIPLPRLSPRSTVQQLEKMLQSYA